MVEMEMGMGMVEEESCTTPRCRIPAVSVCPPPPKKKSLVVGGKKKRDPPKGGYFQPPDLDAFLSLAPRRQAYAA
ncbi:hypothetical protein Tsubulata_028918 [Turnera subulata]|uniref:Cyclin-dependent protein kinase inhibitor SMR4 n=1 Tax=Turnera subulata TaxID=218843 RepID=A0A9Q0GIE1_9ROSI|nr:hypothetical protein Tsubulata_028918 [Turnera subulata]